MTRDVTKLVRVGPIDDENIPMTQCVCGNTYQPWEGPILNYDSPVECPACLRKFIFQVHVKVLEVQ